MNYFTSQTLKLRIINNFKLLIFTVVKKMKQTYKLILLLGVILLANTQDTPREGEDLGDEETPIKADDAANATTVDPRCCYSKWGDNTTCGLYPSGGSGGLCTTDWTKKCNSPGDCPATPVPPPTPGNGTIPVEPWPTPTPPPPTPEKNCTVDWQHCATAAAWCCNARFSC